MPRFDETSSIGCARGRTRRPASAPVPPRPPRAFTSPTSERFQHDLAAYRALPGGESARDEDLFPQLGDWREVHELDAHYFHQDTWAANRIAELRPRATSTSARGSTSSAS